MPGWPITASISSRDRNPSTGRSNRFIGTPNACSTTCKLATSLRPANLRNERNAASLALRLRTALWRSTSRWSRKARISEGVISVSKNAVGGLFSRFCAKFRKSTKASRYAATVRGLRARCCVRCSVKNDCTRAEKLGEMAGLFMIKFPSTRKGFESGTSQCHQLRHAGEVPVSVRNLDMTHIGGQGQHALVQIDVLLMPQRQTLHC